MDECFPPLYVFTIEKFLVVRGFAVRGLLFPPKIREDQGLPVFGVLFDGEGTGDQLNQEIITERST